MLAEAEVFSLAHHSSGIISFVKSFFSKNYMLNKGQFEHILDEQRSVTASLPSFFNAFPEFNPCHIFTMLLET